MCQIGLDGRRTIAEIIDVVAGSGTVARADREATAGDGLVLCRSLWEQDFLAMRIRR